MGCRNHTTLPCGSNNISPMRTKASLRRTPPPRHSNEHHSPPHYIPHSPPLPVLLAISLLRRSGYPSTISCGAVIRAQHLRLLPFPSPEHWERALFSSNSYNQLRLVKRSQEAGRSQGVLELGLYSVTDGSIILPRPLDCAYDLVRTVERLCSSSNGRRRHQAIYLSSMLLGTLTLSLTTC